MKHGGEKNYSCEIRTAHGRHQVQSSDRRKDTALWVFPAGQQRRQIVSAAGLSGPTALCAIISSMMWRSGDDTAVAVAKYVGVFAVGMGCLLVVAATQHFQVFHGGNLRSGADEGDAATTVPGSKTFFWAQQAMWFCYAILFLPAAYEIATTAWHEYWHLVIIFAGIGTFATIPLAAALAGRLRPGKLILTPRAIVHEGWSSRTRLLWEDVNRVRTSFERVPIIDIAGMSGARWSVSYYSPSPSIVGRPNPAWNLDRPPHTGWVVLECPRFSVDRVALYRYLDFYAENPELRDELGTDSALERWRLLAGDRR